jgi:hypothetical protein
MPAGVASGDGPGDRTGGRRSRSFRIGTLVVALVVAAAIVNPVLRRGRHGPQRLRLSDVLVNSG